MTSRSQDDAVEFRAGTLNDLLEAAKGGRPEAAADAKRLRSMAIGGGVSSAVLAIALVVILLTGGGGKGADTATTSTTVAPLPAPPGTRTLRVSLADSRVPSDVKPGSTIGLTDGQTTVDGIVVLAVNTEKTKIVGTTSIRLNMDIAVKLGDLGTYAQINKQTMQAFGGEAPAAPPSTASSSS